MPILVFALVLGGLFLANFLSDEETSFIGSVEFAACDHSTESPPPLAPTGLPSVSPATTAGVVPSQPGGVLPGPPTLGRATGGEPTVTETSPASAELAKR